MAHETIGEPSPPAWRMKNIRTPSADLQRNASLGFVRLAQLAKMSLPLEQAYYLRQHPDVHLLRGELIENLRHLAPADLGRFMVMEQVNGINRIYSKAASGELGLTLFVPDTPLHQKGPEREWCDAAGNPHRILRAPGREYGRAMKFLDDLDLATDAIRQCLMKNQDDAAAYRQGWADAGSELLASHLAYLKQAREDGPVLELDRRIDPDATILGLLDTLRTPPEPQSGGMIA